MMKVAAGIAGALALILSSGAVAKPGFGMGRGNPHAMGMMPGLGYGARGHVGHGVGGCPPGLAKKAIPCVPPGQAMELYGVGQRLPLSLGSLIAYSALSRSLRTRYAPMLSPRSRYIYSNGYLYRVNPRTRVVVSVIRTR